MRFLVVVFFILFVWVNVAFSNYQTRNSDNVDIERMQRYVEHINATGQLNNYDRR